MPTADFVLASGSPRRQELLAWTGWKFRIMAVNVDETPVPGEAPLVYVLRLAEKKARSAGILTKDSLILAADTTVANGLEILGKPESALDATAMLIRLRGRQHMVMTALVMLENETGKVFREVCTSQVHMRNYTDEEISEYVSTGDPLDKAGAYAIQHGKFQPVEQFTGCFANVMGLPLCHLVRLVGRVGVPAVKDVAVVCQHNLQYDCPVFRQILDGAEVG